MKNNLRISAAMLAMLTLAITAASCGDSAKTSAQTDSKTKTDGQKTTEPVTETADPRAPYRGTAPAVEDLGGYAYRMAVIKGGATCYKQVSYWTEEQNGDTLNDAIYLRNLAVEEAYNVKTSLIELEDTNAALRRNIQAGDDFADVVFCWHLTELIGIAQEGCFLDLNAIPELRLDQPWWDQRIQTLSIYDKLYCATGDISIRDDLREMSVIFDKKLYDEFDFPDPYEFVSTGTWTWEQMSSMVRDVTKDLDGNGKLNCLDQWGLVSETPAGWYLFLGSGRDTISYQNGKYTADISDPAIYNVLEDILSLLADKNAAIIMDDGRVGNDITTESIWTEATKMFSEDRVLFRTCTFGDTVDLRNMQKDFGVLPIPKYTQEQKEYYCMVSIDNSPLVIPTTVQDIHKCALITEALAYESMFTLTPKFYEVFLDEKILRDEKSKEMIDILFDSKVYSLDYYAGVTGLQAAIGQMIASGKNNLASKTASIQKSAQNKLDKFVANFEN